MTELFLNRARTCAVTGHRNLEPTFNRRGLEDLLKKVIQAGFNTFLIGMALGFDIECLKILNELKTEYPIKTIACIPCESQAYKFTAEQKEEYDNLLKTVDEQILISKTYTKYCMMKRNRYMVDNCGLLLSYLKRDFGGTFNTVEYARQKGIQILPVE